MFLQLAALVAVAVSGLLAVTINDCPPFLPRKGLRAHGQSCYLFYVNYERQFPTAQEVCKILGGHLAIIRDMDTQNFLYLTTRNVFGLKDGPVWIGLTDVWKEGHYTWVDGSPATFTHWSPGQPGWGHWDENCVAMDMSDGGRWSDYLCGDIITNHRHPYICEYPIIKTTTPSPTTPDPTTPDPTTPEPTTPQPTTPEPTTPEPTTLEPTPPVPTTLEPTTPEPTTLEPTTPVPTTPEPTTPDPTTPEPTTPEPTTPVPTDSSECPKLVCSKDCSLGGYKMDDHYCFLCECA